jgi:hypothetical protein
VRRCSRSTALGATESTSQSYAHELLVTAPAVVHE